jgi:CheY-like chemotaxis protein
MRCSAGSADSISSGSPRVSGPNTNVLLDDSGLIIDQAEDGEEAIVVAQKRSYAAILMDMQMPQVNGLEATRQIREIPGHRRTPIIAMTGNALEEDKTRC